MSTEVDSIVGRVVFSKTIQRSARLTIMGVPNIVDCKNDDDLVLQNGEEDIEGVKYDDIDNNFCPPLMRGQETTKKIMLMLGQFDKCA
jgi:hypothetical protein